MEQVRVEYFGGSGQDVSVEQRPDECPRCHKQIEPARRVSIFRKDDSEDNFDMVLQCTSRDCGRLFIAEYEKIGVNGSYNLYQTKRTEPYNAEKIEFSEEISSVSLEFTNIYNEAFTAERLGMSHIAGMGFGKALEFLVKDFAKDQNPNKEDEIERKPLGNCINDHVFDESVRNMAKRAAWLRNDESHYIRKWEGKDIKDLKVLIRLVVNAIVNVKLAQKYETEMT